MSDSDNTNKEIKSYEHPEKPLSKKKQKKLAKKELKMRLWKETRSEMRKERKERAKERKKEMRESGQYIPRKKKRTTENLEIGGKVIIDCDFDDKMNENEVKSLFNQIQLLYGANWKYEHPLEIRCIGVNGKLKELIEKREAHKWKLITFEEKKIEEIKNEVQCVYLAAESETVIDNFNKEINYVIGGIVDHNKFKRLCENKANSLNISTARLPIEQHIECIGRKVLTVNQVFEIIGEQCQTNNWDTTIQKILPQRKQEVPPKNEPKSDEELSL
ncbi:hypothetical protein ENUP19_0039G0021 [Entamoeba nuttalli]|uniref:tRNA (guanine(9)-N(1))-methyltransferase n=2 Tax=Entamoeba nuttalli TaxID=412467 RepID=K2G4U3_ENTNP|nr:tRNA (guanine-N1-)-methyltransferase [Entamoeba nuttalli P19]EKE37341.1 tRNA (guanine-N1-)-methyltransferase [Entamoeba nuttalli P19]|eukprot:XP_008860324.1 tRNA (guanine-N1-)-methyltransferase [Entamoeba nuttalli P19]